MDGVGAISVPLVNLVFLPESSRADVIKRRCKSLRLYSILNYYAHYNTNLTIFPLHFEISFPFCTLKFIIFKSRLL